MLAEQPALRDADAGQLRGERQRCRVQWRLRIAERQGALLGQRLAVRVVVVQRFGLIQT